MDDTVSDIVRQELKSAVELHKALADFFEEEDIKKVLQEKVGTSLKVVSNCGTKETTQGTYVNTALGISIVKENPYPWPPDPEQIVSFEVISYRTYLVKNCRLEFKPCIRSLLLAFYKRYDAVYFMSH
jgi:hypothetical protein